MFVLASTAPGNVSAIAHSSTSINLTWNQPTSFNGVLHNYNVRYKLISDTNFGTPISAGTKVAYTVTGLRPFADYEFQVCYASFQLPTVTLTAEHSASFCSFMLRYYLCIIRTISCELQS